MVIRLVNKLLGSSLEKLRLDLGARDGCSIGKSEEFDGGLNEEVMKGTLEGVDEDKEADTFVRMLDVKLTT